MVSLVGIREILEEELELTELFIEAASTVVCIVVETMLFRSIDVDVDSLPITVVENLAIGSVVLDTVRLVVLYMFDATDAVVVFSDV